MRALPSPELTVAQMIHQLHNSAGVHAHTTSILRSGGHSLVEECVTCTVASTLQVLKPEKNMGFTVHSDQTD